MTWDDEIYSCFFSLRLLTCQVDRSLEPFSWASVDVRRVVVGVAQWLLMINAGRELQVVKVLE